MPASRSPEALVSRARPAIPSTTVTAATLIAAAAANAGTVLVHHSHTVLLDA